eukprot:3315841-Rhodomonas_salina.7
MHHHHQTAISESASTSKAALISFKVRSRTQTQEPAVQHESCFCFARDLARGQRESGPAHTASKVQAAYSTHNPHDYRVRGHLALGGD